MNVAIGLTVDTSGEDLIDRLNRKVKQLQASLRAINAEMRQTAKAVTTPGSAPTQTTKTNQGKADSDAKRSAADLYSFKSRIEAQRQREATRNEAFLRRLRQSSYKQQERDSAKAIKDRVAGEARAAREAKTGQAAAARAASADMRAIRDKVQFSVRMNAQRVREHAATERARAAQAAVVERDQKRTAREEARSLKERMSFVSRMAAQRAREEAETARAQDRSAREAIRLDRYRLGLRDREERRLAREAAREDRDRSRDYRSGLINARSAASHGRDSYNTLTRTGAAAAIVGTAATASLARRALTAESDIDSAEINSRIYGGLSQDAARQLRDQWAAPLAEQLGVGTAKLLSSYTDALKVGIDPTGAKEFSALATQTSEAWGVPFEGVVDILGTVNSILTSTGDAFDFGKLKGVANSIQYLAAKQSTTPEKLISFLQRGAGGAQVLGMSQEAGLAFGSASTSLGNQAAESGRLFDFIAGRLVSMPDLVKKKGVEGTRAKELVRNLGYGSAGELDRQRREAPDDFLPDFVRRFNGVKDTKKQEQLLKFFAGQEWFGEFGRIVKGFDKYKEAADLAKESKKLDAIGDVWNLHKLKLSFVFKQISTGFLNIMGEIGKVLSPMARQVGDYFLEWSRKLQGGGLRLRVQAAAEGFISGLGFKDLPVLLKGIFGEPGQGDAGAVETWRNTAQAFAEGIRDTLNALKSLFTVFTGSNATPETIARWTGRLITFAAACLIAAPAIAVLGGLASGITALAVAALGAWKLLKAAGLVGGASAAAGAAGAAGSSAGAGAGAAAGAATGAGLLSSLMRIFGGAAINTVPAYPKDEADDLTRRLGKFAQERNQARENAAPAWVDPPAKSTAEAIILPKPEVIQPITPQARNNAGAIILPSPQVVKPANPPGKTDNGNFRKPAEDLKKAIEDNTLIHKQSFESQDNLSGLIRKANFINERSGPITKATIQGGGADLKAAVTTGSTGALGSGSVGGGPLSSSVPGSALGNTGISGRGIIGGGRTSPGLGAGAGANVNAGGSPGASDASGPSTPGDKRLGGSRSWRNNNPGNIEFGSFARSMGATGTDGRFAVFPDYKSGRNAQEKLLFEGKNYANLTLAQAIRRWAPASENNVPAYIAAMKADPNTRMRDFTPDQRSTLLDAMQRHEGWKVGRTVPGASQPVGGASGAVMGGTVHSANKLVGVASQYVGLGEGRGRDTLENFMGGGSIVGEANAWCARFVNASLKAVGDSGTGSGIANSFLRWGKAVEAEAVKAGDIAVEHRNRGVDGRGGHVGIATGKTRIGRNGQLQLELIEGNSSNQVKKDWTDASKLAVRRSTNPAAQVANEAKVNQAEQQQMARPATPHAGTGTGLAPDTAAAARDRAKDLVGTGWKPSGSGDGPQPVGKPGLGGSAPLGRDAPISPVRAGQTGGSSTTTVSAPISINGANQSPEQIAAAVERKLSQNLNRRTHDLDPSSMSGIG
ncbi:phage tail tape measure protein [Methylorubrum extorquens]|uniref:Phage tail tape measure protein n=1 Tax=Methylorubrum extorquens TaxID=408 RepID=A0A1S1P9M1_METEX|nr:phage tail tape measure protein [Methylorubrum extorquens]